MKTRLEQNQGWVGVIAAKARGTIALRASVGIVLPMLCLWPGLTPAVLAQALAPEPAKTSPQAVDCPPGDLSALVTQLMLDLPSYSNRVIQRASRLDNPAALYLIAAGQVEISPVSLAAIADDPHRSRLPVENLRRDRPAEEIYQVFFTTLERQYRRSPRKLAKSLRTSPLASADPTLNPTAPSFQQFHWLILARLPKQAEQNGQQPWRIISLRSQLAPYPAADNLLAPARESRQGFVGQGIALWFRDWHSSGPLSGSAKQDSHPVNGVDANAHCVTQ